MWASRGTGSKAARNLPQGGGLRKPRARAQLGPVADTKAPESAGKTDSRKARLATALRANLQRRKAQAREQAREREAAGEAGPESSAPGAAPEGHIGRRVRQTPPHGGVAALERVRIVSGGGRPGS